MDEENFTLDGDDASYTYLYCNLCTDYVGYYDAFVTLGSINVAASHHWHMNHAS